MILRTFEEVILPGGACKMKSDTMRTFSESEISSSCDIIKFNV